MPRPRFPQRVGAACLVSLLTCGTVSAIPTLAIDLDPATLGIQSALTVALGASFDVDVVLIGDGSTQVDAVLMDVPFNDAGTVLAVAGLPTAGELAGEAPTALLVLDAVTASLVFPSSFLSSAGAPVPPGFANGIGGAGYFALGGPFVTLAADESSTILHLSFVAVGAGSSTVATSGVFGGTELAFQGSSVVPDRLFGTVNVAAVPEPRSLLLLGLASLAMARVRFVGRQRRPFDSTT